MKPKVHEKDAPAYDEPYGLVVRLRPVLELSPDQLLELSSLNSDLRLELTAEGELIVMTPAGGESSKQNLEPAIQLGVWAKRDGTGFVIELCSPSDQLSVLQDKMREYIENEAKPGWLIDPSQRRVYVYRPKEPVQVLENPEKVSGDPALPGFVLDLREVRQ